MVALPQVYNTTDLPDTGGSMPLIPPGQYPAVIVDSGMKETSNRQGQFLWLKLIITAGQYANTEFTERLNIINQNNTAVEIAYKTLARISEAVGMTQTPGDSMQLHNRSLIIDVSTEAGKAYTDNNGQQKMGSDKSIIKKYLPVPGMGAAAPAQGAFNNAPAPLPAAGGFRPPAALPFAPAQPAANAAPANNPFAPPR